MGSPQFEFLSSLQPRIKDVEDPLSKAYFKKYEECINKAKSSFANDPVFKPYLESFEKEKLKRNINLIRDWCTEHWLLLSAIIIGLIIGVSSICSSIDKAITKSRIENLKEQIIQTAHEGDFEKARQMYNDGENKYKNRNGWNGRNIIVPLFEYALTKDLREAEKLYNEYDYWFEDEMEKAYLNAESIEDYWRICRDKYNKGEDRVERYNAMEEVVKFYCGRGDVKSAKAFVNKNVNWFYTNIDKDPKINEESGLFSGGHSDWKPYKKARVQERLNAVINQY